jgi:hypothetical protein
MKCIDIFIVSLEEITKTFDSHVSMISPLENWELLHNYLHLDNHNYHHVVYISHSTISVPMYRSLIDMDDEIIEKSNETIFCV